MLETLPQANLSLEQLLVAITLADQVGAALIAQAPSIAWSLPTTEPPPGRQPAADPDPAAPHLRMIRDGTAEGIGSAQR